MVKAQTTKQVAKVATENPKPPALPKPKPKPRATKPHVKTSRPHEKDGGKMAVFRWDEPTTEAAKMLSQRYTYKEVSEATKIPVRTLQRWNTANIEFMKEVDNLALMVSVSGKANRMSYVHAVVRKITSKRKWTEKDLLDWLKYAQFEMEGAKVDISGILTILNASDNSIHSPTPGSEQGGAEQPSESQEQPAD